LLNASSTVFDGAVAAGAAAFVGGFVVEEFVF